MKEAFGATSALRWLVFALTAGVLYACWPLWPALVLAAWTAELGRPLLVRLERSLGGQRRGAAALLLLLFVFLTLPLLAVLLGVISGARELALLVAQQSSTTNALAFLASGTAGVHLPDDPLGAVELVEHYGTEGLRLVQNVAGAAASGVIALLVYFGGAHAFLLHGASVWSWVQRHSPLEPAHLERLGSAFHETGRGLLVGVGLTSATQGLIATVAYFALGTPRWWVLGPLTGLASMIPVVGSALVWAPLSVALFLTGHPLKAGALALFGAVVISTVDNLLHPVYARLGSLNMPTFLVFVALFGGIAAFGVWGALLGPLIVRLWIEALALQTRFEPTQPAR